MNIINDPKLKESILAENDVILEKLNRDKQWFVADKKKFIRQQLNKYSSISDVKDVIRSYYDLLNTFDFRIENITRGRICIQKDQINLLDAIDTQIGILSIILNRNVFPIKTGDQLHSGMVQYNSSYEATARLGVLKSYLRKDKIDKILE